MSLSPQDLVGGRIPTGPLSCEGEYEFRCRRCHARCSRSPTSDLEYGHKNGCPRRPDHFPYAEGANYDPAADPLRDDEASPELVTDGGEATTHELADGTGKSLSTVYRALEVIDTLVENSNGHVSIVSKKLEQDLREIFERTERQVEIGAEAIARMLHMDPQQVAQQGSAWQKWLRKYAVQTIEDGDRLTLKVQAVMDRLKSTGCPRLAAVLDEGLRAYDQAGGDPATSGPRGSSGSSPAGIAGPASWARSSAEATWLVATLLLDPVSTSLVDFLFRFYLCMATCTKGN